MAPGRQMHGMSSKLFTQNYAVLLLRRKIALHASASFFFLDSHIKTTSLVKKVLSPRHTSQTNESTVTCMYHTQSMITLLYYYQDLPGTLKAIELWSATTASLVAYDSIDLQIFKTQMEDPTPNSIPRV